MHTRCTCTHTCTHSASFSVFLSFSPLYPSLPFSCSCQTVRKLQTKETGSTHHLCLQTDRQRRQAALTIFVYRQTDKGDRQHSPSLSTDRQRRQAALTIFGYSQTDKGDTIFGYRQTKETPSLATDRQRRHSPSLATDRQRRHSPSLATDRQRRHSPSLATDRQRRHSPSLATDRQTKETDDTIYVYRQRRQEALTIFGFLLLLSVLVDVEEEVLQCLLPPLHVHTELGVLCLYTVNIGQYRTGVLCLYTVNTGQYRTGCPLPVHSEHRSVQIWVSSACTQ